MAGKKGPGRSYKTSRRRYVRMDAWAGGAFMENHVAFLAGLGYEPYFDEEDTFIRFNTDGYPLTVRTAGMHVCASRELDAPRFKPVIVEGYEDDVLEELKRIDPDYRLNDRTMGPLRRMMRRPRDSIQ